MLKKQPANYLKNTDFRLADLAYEGLVVPGSTEGIPPLGALCFKELNEVEKNEFSLESATAIGQLQIQMCGSSTRRMDG